MIQFFHGKSRVEAPEAGDTKFPDPAGDDAVKVIQGRIKIDRDAVPTDPAADPDTKRCDLSFFAGERIKSPNADTSFSRKGRYAEAAESFNDPGFQPFDKGTKILGRYCTIGLAEIQENISQSLSRAMVRPLAASARFVRRVVMWVIKILLLRRRSGRKDGGVLYEPDDGISCSFVNLARAGGHEVQSIRVGC